MTPCRATPPPLPYTTLFRSHLSAMRATPNVTVLRPADANEVASCWKMAIKNEEGPSLMILTRQALPTLDQIGRDTSELQSRGHLVCRLLLEKKNTNTTSSHY